jgi:hypothetical protein
VDVLIETIAMTQRVLLLVLALICFDTDRARGDDIDDLLKDIRAVGAEGAGSAKARIAWDRLVGQGPRVLPRILIAMDTPDTVAANWLRLAFDEIARPQLSGGGKAIDSAALLDFARDAKRQGRARRLALDVVEQLRPGTRQRLFDGWLDDPEFRFDAVERLLEKVQKDSELPKEKALAQLRKAFTHSRDLTQARTAASRLRERGEKVSVADHMGFLRDWFVIGPFDGKNGKGFAAVYRPEKSVDLSATLTGKNGAKLRWQRHSVAESTSGRFPILVDIRKPLGDAEDAVAYAWTAFTVPAARSVEFRGSGDDNLSVWINGERAFGFEEYRNGVRLDRHRFTAKLKAGVNTVLVKICQAPLDPDNSDPNWEFLLRITDLTGRGVIFPPALK